MRRVVAIWMLVGLLLGVAATAADTPIYGGSATYAVHSMPNTLDVHATSARAALVDAGIYIFETLTGFGEGWVVRPMLAKSWEFSDDLLTVTFYLREGVKFHDGSEFDAYDFLASYDRFLAISPGAPAFAPVARVYAPDPYTVVFECSEVFTTLPELLCQEAYYVAVFPEEVCVGNPGPGSIEIIGTGPYKLKRWIEGSEIALERFEDYVMDDRPTDGFVGQKHAYLDEIIFKRVPEDEIKFAGLLTGEFVIAQPLPGDYVDRVLGAANQGIALRTFTDMKPFVYLSVQPDSPLADARMRQAIRIALDYDSIMYAATTNEARYFVNPDELMFEEQYCWDPTIMADVSNQANIAEAKRLAAAAGYKGEPITFLASIGSFHHRRPALEISEQLKAAGFNVELQLKDWSVVVANLSNWDSWDMWYARNVYFSYGHIAAIGNGGYDSPVFQDILSDLRRTTDPDVLCGLLAQLRREVLVPDVPVIMFGDMFGVGAQTTRLKGADQGYYGYLANAWLNE